MKILMVIIAIILLVSSVSAEIVYSDQFYDNQNKSQEYVNTRTIGSGVFALVYEQRNTNELLMKQNELLQEHNNLTITQNEILNNIFQLLSGSIQVHFR